MLEKNGEENRPVDLGTKMALGILRGLTVTASESLIIAVFEAGRSEISPIGRACFVDFVFQWGPAKGRFRFRMAVDKCGCNGVKLRDQGTLTGGDQTQNTMLCLEGFSMLQGMRRRPCKKRPWYVRGRSEGPEGGEKKGLGDGKKAVPRAEQPTHKMTQAIGPTLRDRHVRWDCEGNGKGVRCFTPSGGIVVPDRGSASEFHRLR